MQSQSLRSFLWCGLGIFWATIGLAHCKNFRAHIYMDSNIDKTYAASLRPKCPKTSGSGDSNLSPLDYMTPTVFDNNYYVNLKNQKGLFHSDQALFNGGSTDSQVTTYSSNQTSTAPTRPAEKSARLAESLTGRRREHISMITFIVMLSCNL